MRSRQGDKGCDPCQRAIRTNRPVQRAISILLLNTRIPAQLIRYGKIFDSRSK